MVVTWNSNGNVIVDELFSVIYETVVPSFLLSISTKKSDVQTKPNFLFVMMTVAVDDPRSLSQLVDGRPTF